MPVGTLFSSTSSTHRKIEPASWIFGSGSTTRVHSNWKRAGSRPVPGQPSRPLVAKKASTKKTEVTTMAAAFTHQRSGEVRPTDNSSTPSTT